MSLLNRYRQWGVVYSIIIILIPLVPFMQRGSAIAQQQRVYLSVVADHTEVTSPSTIVVVVSLSTTGTLSDTNATLEFAPSAGATILGLSQDSIATVCSWSSQSATCQGSIDAQKPQLAAFRIGIDPLLPLYTQLEFNGTATVNGANTSGSDTVFVKYSTATTTPSSPTPTATSNPSSPTPTATSNPSSPTPTATSNPSRPTNDPTTTVSSPSGNAESTPTAIPDSPAETVYHGDMLENNYDPEHASLIAPNTDYRPLDFVAPSTTGLGDVDYVRWFAKKGRCYTLETIDLSTGLDTNIEIVNDTNQVLAGNDDISPTDARSEIEQCVDHDHMMIARIAQNTSVPLDTPFGKTYTLKLSVREWTVPSPTANPVSVLPPLPATNDQMPTKGGQPNQPVIEIPSQRSVAPIGQTDSIPSGSGTQPVQESTNAVCQPVVSTPVSIDGSGIMADGEPCDEQMDIKLDEIPLGTAHVTVKQAGLYHGPGTQYTRIALLPYQQTVRLTGQTRHGYVSVSLVGQTHVAPLIGWMWGPYLAVDAWDSGTTVQPVVKQPTIQIPNNGSVASPVLNAAFRVTPTSNTRKNVIVNVCQQTTTSTATCLPAQGIRSARVYVMNNAGDIFATGVTNDEGRVSVDVYPTRDLRVVIPLLSISQSLALNADDTTVVHVPVRAAIIPSVFR